MSSIALSMRLLLTAIAVVMLAVEAQNNTSTTRKPCLEVEGAQIRLNGNMGTCYLTGKRRQVGSIYAHCRDGKLTCYVDEAIPDKIETEVPCVKPEEGHCLPKANSTASPSPISRPTNGSRSLDDEVGDLDSDLSAQDELNDDDIDLIVEEYGESEGEDDEPYEGTAIDASEGYDGTTSSEQLDVDEEQ